MQVNSELTHNMEPGNESSKGASAVPHPNNEAGLKLPVESNLRWNLLGAQVLWALASVSAQVCSSVIT